MRVCWGSFWIGYATAYASSIALALAAVLFLSRVARR